ncbi:MAG: hypothetical protein KAS12_07010, partial [Candidatus Aenigmarchaeota archaeon]|nr:hypothetical protein [Candidatus Aenigmarchaeota archaeon]
MPTTEERTDFLFKQNLGKSSTGSGKEFYNEIYNADKINFSNNIWQSTIPQTAPTLSDGEILNNVRYFEKHSFAPVDGSENAFYLSDFKNAVPFNFGDGSYNFVIYDSIDNKIEFSEGDWLADNTSGVITFYATLPDNMPPKISFYQYVGLTEISIEKQIIEQTAHGFSNNDVVYNNNGTWALAQANAESTTGTAIIASSETNRFATVFSGILNIPSHAFGNPGDTLYVSTSSAGDMTTTKPTSGFITSIASIIDANNIYVSAKATITVSASDIDFIRYDIAQNTHSFSVLDPIYNNNGTWTLAQANAESTIATAVVYSVLDVDNFVAINTGLMTLTAHGLGNSGQTLFVSQTVAGGLTTTKPTTGLINPIGVIMDANMLNILSQRGDIPVGITSHSDLTELSTDDHTQYALLAGRAGDKLNIDEIVIGGLQITEFIQNGFVDRADSVLTYNLGTSTLTLTPTGTTFKVISNNNVFHLGTTSLAHSPANGHFYYYINDSGNLAYTTIDEDYLIKSYAYVSEVIINNDEIIHIGDERHGHVMSPESHKIFHLAIGTVYASGGAIDGIVDGVGDLDIHAQINISETTIYDEDIKFTHAVLSVGDAWTTIYRSGTASWDLLNQAAPCSKGTDRLYYNENIAGVWQLTEITSNKQFVLYHIVATNDSYSSRRFLSIMGINQYSKIADARVGANDEINELNLATLPMAEWVIMGTLIYETSTDFTNTFAGIIRSTTEGDDYINWLKTRLNPVMAPTNHSNLSGLSVDAHKQYAFLAGRVDDVYHINELENLAGITSDLLVNGVGVKVPTANTMTFTTGTSSVSAIGTISLNQSLATTDSPAFVSADLINAANYQLRLKYDGTYYGDFQVDSAGKIFINSVGAGLGVNITSGSTLTHAMEINDAGGNCLRLINNDNNGAPDYYTDFVVSSNGSLTISPSGPYTTINTQLLLSIGGETSVLNSIASGLYLTPSNSLFLIYGSQEIRDGNLVIRNITNFDASISPDDKTGGFQLYSDDTSSGKNITTVRSSDTTFIEFNVGRSRGVNATPTNVADTDVIVSGNEYLYYNGDMRLASYCQTVVNGTPSTSNYGCEKNWYTCANGEIVPVARFGVNGSGNFYVGPSMFSHDGSDNLTLTTAGKCIITSGGNPEFEFNDGTTAFNILLNASGSVSVSTTNGKIDMLNEHIKIFGVSSQYSYCPTAYQLAPTAGDGRFAAYDGGTAPGFFARNTNGYFARIQLETSEGTLDTPLATTAGTIGGINFGSYDGTAWHKTPGRLIFNATETHSPTAHGTQFSVQTTKNEGTTLSTKLTVGNEGNIIQANCSTAASSTTNAAAIFYSLGIAADVYIGGSTYLAAPTQITSTTSSQLDIRYDATNYATFGVNSGGELSIKTTGNRIICDDTESLLFKENASISITPTGYNTSTNEAAFLAVNIDDETPSNIGFIARTIKQSTATPAIIKLQHAYGTAAAPTATLGSAQLGRIEFGGHDGTGWTDNKGALIIATNSGTTAWSGTNTGSDLLFYTTPQATNVQTLKLKIFDDGQIVQANCNKAATSGTNAAAEFYSLGVANDTYIGGSIYVNGFSSQIGRVVRIYTNATSSGVGSRLRCLRNNPLAGGAVLSGNQLSAFESYGYYWDDPDKIECTIPSARIECNATQNFSTTGWGGNIKFWTITTDTKAIVNRLEIEDQTITQLNSSVSATSSGGATNLYSLYTTENAYINGNLTVNGTTNITLSHDSLTGLGDDDHS